MMGNEETCPARHFGHEGPEPCQAQSQSLGISLDHPQALPSTTPSTHAQTMVCLVLHYLPVLSNSIAEMDLKSEKKKKKKKKTLVSRKYFFSLPE
jgi:hypothetical protein